MMSNTNRIYTRDGRAELVSTDTSAVIARTDRALLYESCTLHSARLFARQFTVDCDGETVGRYLTLDEAQRAYDMVIQS